MMPMGVRYEAPCHIQYLSVWDSAVMMFTMTLRNNVDNGADWYHSLSQSIALLCGSILARRCSLTLHCIFYNLWVDFFSPQQQKTDLSASAKRKRRKSSASAAFSLEKSDSETTSTVEVPPKPKPGKTAGCHVCYSPCLCFIHVSCCWHRSNIAI